MPGKPPTPATTALRLKSGAGSPFAELDLWQRGLLFAECAWLGTFHTKICRERAREMGFIDARPIHHERALATWFQTDHDSLILFRHARTPTIWKDVKSVAKSPLALADTAGKVHQESQEIVERIWPAVERELSDDDRPLWFAGYSQGGVIATLCTLKCVVSPLHSQPEELHTFGSPRPGNHRFCDSLKVPHHRWVNGRDLVPHIPARWRGYQHNGDPHRVNEFGNLETPPEWERWLEPCRDAQYLVGLREGRVLLDHSMDAYVDGLFSVLRQKGSKPAR